MQDVVELLDQWQGEDHRYFRVRTADHACFLVRFDESDRRWSLVSFEAGREKSSGKRSL
jgi:hypothetical protein